MLTFLFIISNINSAYTYTGVKYFYMTIHFHASKNRSTSKDVLRGELTVQSYSRYHPQLNKRSFLLFISKTFNACIRNNLLKPVCYPNKLFRLFCSRVFHLIIPCVRSQSVTPPSCQVP